ncbi:polymorphic toxin-type HINT domain-containing protein [Novipirellula artificiosorum]|uniref:Hint domain-containing protein n=1 Tax=Novipirellula artificiosorum TaxID=2528016 RepID=A0A5C6DAX0_9BACT|nr:polymorphic toxin-type HINT domain-containing protein [Novipirellula artificiosorum]TWU32877.1 hypothetical protein Poly41_52540 [Novipirellula artificiosorum]
MFNFAMGSARIDQVVLGCRVALIVALATIPALAVELKSVDDPLRNTLNAEADGKLIDRTASESDLDQAKDPVAARWHAGQVYVDGTWVNMCELSQQRLTRASAKYAEQRGDGELDADGHRRLAMWAETHGLESQAHAHWQNVLAAVPNDRIARSRLGYQRVNGEWLTKQEIRQAEQLFLERQRQTRVWLPRMKTWANSLLGTNAKRKMEAIESIQAIDDPSAIDAIKLAALQLPSDAALPFVDSIKSLRSRQACDALAQIAIADPGSKRGQAAIDGLKQYRMEFYVPPMIQSLSTNIQLQHQVFTRPTGEQVLRTVKSRELQDLQQVEVVDKVMLGTNVTVFQTTTRRSGLAASVYRPNAMGPIAREVVQRDSQREIQRIKGETEQLNSTRSIEDGRILNVLQALSGDDNGQSPQAWWSWWDRYNEQITYGEKPVAYRYKEDRSETPYINETVVNVRQSCECLIAGTKVQTEFGPRAIETIRCGDLVPSQDVETGELTLKPVLRTTIRPPAKTLRFVTKGGSIEATLGHYWWVAGEGWLRTKELQVGMMLHHATGTTRIKAIEDVAEPAETYNLVVADFHTYFVGAERILSNDATELSPTLQVVPGLPAMLASTDAGR